ncbi:MAG: hypothetical protein B1H09_06400 [Gemmatimonadaceae bacterium 4484_173]|nr:MAG: hypothetical protein B1H09_06400 [Gemmatimonadaceae bacterium 4484_173]
MEPPFIPLSIDYISKLAQHELGRIILSGLLLILAVTALEHVVTVNVGDPYLLETDNLYTILLPEFYSVESDGRAPLPCSVRFFPVPPGSEPRLEWAVGSTGSTGWDRSLVTASAPVFAGSGLHTTQSFHAVPFPSEHSPVSLEIIHLLGTTVAKVTISPFCYGTPAAYAKQISYSLSYPETSGGRSIEGTLLGALCPDAETWWPDTQRSPESPFWGKPWARIGVDNTGFYSVTGEELEASGCTVTGVPSASLALFSGPGTMFDPADPGQEHQLAPVAVTVFDGGDGVFDAADSLIFYGRELWHWNFTADSLFRSSHRFDTANTYWLTWGGSNGARIVQSNASPSGGPEIQQGVSPFGFEQEVFWEFCENRTGWVWDYLGGDFAAYFYLSIPHSSDNATVRLSIVNGGVPSQTHEVQAELEDVVILDTLARDTVGNSRMEYFTLRNIDVKQGGNLLEVWCDYPGGSYFNYAEILLPVSLSESAGYPVAVSGYTPGLHSMHIGSVSPDCRIYNISDPFNPVSLTDWTLSGNEAHLSTTVEGETAVFLTVEPENFLSPEYIEPAQPGRLLGASVPADVIVTVPEDLAGGLSVLEAVYEARGLSVFTVTYTEVYDEFGQGVSDPGAVRSLVRWALDTWSDPPQALVLIGDGSNDPIGYVTGNKTSAPVNVILESGFCKEAYFTTVHTGGKDPEIPVSRIPASTVDELLIASQKAAAIEDPSVLGPWANTVLLAADDEWGKGAYVKDSYHTVICEYLADSIIPPSANIVKLYEIQYPWPPGSTAGGVHPEKPEASSDFVELLNEGMSYLAFVGHGSYDQMTHEKLFSSIMVSQLNNAPRYFLYNSFSCSNGHFDLSAGDCLAEHLLFHPGGGAFATIACTRGSYALANRYLSSHLLTRFHDGSFSTAEALWLSQVEIGDSNNYLYAVLGDGGAHLPAVETQGYSAVPADTLTRGRVNTVDVSFPEESSFYFRCTESADTVVYVSPLSDDCIIPYLRYGSEVYSSILSTDPDGNASVDFFVSLQADTGNLARTDATGRTENILGTGYSWPIPLVDNGDYVDDTTGPSIDLSFPCSQGDEIPSVYQNAMMHAVLSDSSGICVLGDDAGSIIIGSVDGGYEDITSLFSYDRGSYTTGSLDYSIPDLLPGIHQIRVVARDGMKNTGESTLEFNVLQGDAPLLEKTGVYPNPVRGPRAFFFTTSSAGTVEVSVFTIAGRPVWSGRVFVQTGSGQLMWNGKDTDGDSIAAGAYIYKIRFSGSSGSSSVTDLLVVSPQ